MSLPDSSGFTMRPGRPRHVRPMTARDRRPLIVVVSGVPIAVLLVILAATRVFSSGEHQTAAPPAVAESSGTVHPTAAEVAPSETTSAAAVTPSTQRPAQPADLIAATQGSVSRLVRDGDLDAQSGKELNQRLGEAAQALAAGETEKVWNKLRETAEKVVKLRDENKITVTGYDTLKTEFAQLAQALPQP